MWGENENKIPGLDITIAREEDVLTTTLFGRKTFGGVYFNFESDPPVDYKKVLIKNLLLRAYNICSLLYKILSRNYLFKVRLSDEWVSVIFLLINMFRSF